MLDIRNIVVGTICTFIRYGVKLSKEVKVHNQDILINNILKREINQPVVTVVNHISVMDDPSMWAISLPFRNLWDVSTARFSLGAKEILFTNPIYRFVFGYCGQAIPIVRGAGLKQPGVFEAIEKLNQGKWINLFPEGKVNQSGKLIPLRWGVAKMLKEVDRNTMKPPFVVPIHLSGFDKILPEGKWRIPRIFGKRIHIHIGEPFLVEEEFEKHKNASEAAILSEITTFIFKKMQALEEKSKLVELENR